MPLVIERCRWLMRPVATQPGVTRLAGSQEQPGAHIDLLHRIFRILRIARRPAREILGHTQMRKDGLFKAGEFIGFWHLHALHGWHGALQ